MFHFDLNVYMLCWLLAIILAFNMSIQYKISLYSKLYYKYITQKWKVVSFLGGTSLMVLPARYSGDVTWTYTDALIMSILTYITAPWAVGIVYKFIRNDISFKHLSIALCFALFSFSWVYDIYIYMTLGFYPSTWSSNMALSMPMYILAGMVWNLGYTKTSGIFFGFMKVNWMHNTCKFKDIYGYAILLSSIILIELVSFLIFFKGVE